MINKTCNLCGCDSHSNFMTINDTLLNNPKEYLLIKCNNCGLIKLEPPPNNPLNSFPDDYPLYEFALNRKTISELQLIKKYTPRRKRIEKFKKTGRILDVGCMDGFFLKNLQNQGWDVYGFDFKTNVADFARNKLNLQNVVSGEIKDMNYPEKFFDIINVWGVIEDMKNPEETLHFVHKWLKDDGIIVIATHHAESIEAKYFGRDWFNWECPRHIFHFSKKTLERLLGKTGFDTISIKYFASEYIIKQSLKNREKRIGKSYGFIKMCFYMIFTKFYVKLAPLFKQGMMLELYAKKTVKKS